LKFWGSAFSGTLKSVLDRLFFVNFKSGGFLRYKVGASVVALRRSGAVTALKEMNRYFLNSDMIVVGSNYWNIIHGMDKGEAKHDLEGIQ
jgi:multimeric flavodoxin WrbA